MSIRLRTLWRGEIPLWKTFWLFGTGIPLLFSFIFICSQTIMTNILGKYSNILYIDFFLIGIFVVYGIFIIVAIWRSAKKYQGSKVWSLLVTLINILVLLWCGGNLGLYLLVKTAIPPAIESKTNYFPEKLKLSESSIEAESLFLKEFNLKFQFYKKDIRKVFFSFFDLQIYSFSIVLVKKGVILFSKMRRTQILKLFVLCITQG